MPPKDKGTPRRRTVKKADSAITPVGDGVEPGRFTAGTGPLAEDMQRDFEEAALRAQSIRMQKLDVDGQPVGDPVHMDGTTATFNVDPGLEGAESSQVASVPASNLPAFPVSMELDFGPIDKLPPATQAVIKELTRIPIPTAVIDRWWPAWVHWPREAEPLATCKVFLTPQGLYVYRQVPAEPETITTGAKVQRYAPVDFEKTRKPVTGYAARNAGIPIVTVAGTVIVQPTGTCGCGNRLKHWAPSWARNNITWGDGVQLAGNATEGR